MTSCSNRFSPICSPLINALERASFTPAPHASPQAFGSLEAVCGLKAVQYWLRAAEAAYDSSSLPEALRLFQHASEIAAVLSAMLQEASSEAHGGNGGLGGIRAVSSSLSSALSGGEGGQRGEFLEDRSSARSSSVADRRPPLRRGNETFTALGLGSEGELDWSIISRTTRVQMERSMALCCLGIMLQHQ